MKIIYITGHKNPDLDTVCSAFAYAVLKRKLDTKNQYNAYDNILIFHTIEELKEAKTNKEILQSSPQEKE